MKKIDTTYEDLYKIAKGIGPVSDRADSASIYASIAIGLLASIFLQDVGMLPVVAGAYFATAPVTWLLYSKKRWFQMGWNLGFVIPWAAAGMYFFSNLILDYFVRTPAI